MKGDSGGKTQQDGCLLQVLPDGSKLSVFATGFRNANGMGMGPHDEITVAPQEGEWTPASGIFPVKQGTFGGAMQVHHREQPPTDYQRPICWLPRRVDNSSGGQVWVPAGHWGPLGGQLLHLSYGQCTIMAVLRDHAFQNSVDPIQQGGAIVLPLQFESGVMRGRFHPRDGHLYLSGLHGGVSNAVQDGCFQRVRYVGESLVMPVAMKSYANGISLTFSEPLDKATAEDADNDQAEQWNYLWSAQYGSPELKPSQPNVEGRDQVVIESASLLADGRTLFLEIPHLRPVSQLQLHLAATNPVGMSRRHTLHATIHQVSTESLDVSGLTRAHGHGYLSEKERDRLVPGLIFRFEQRPQASHDKVLRDAVHRRTSVLEVPANSAATPWLKPGPFRAVIEGYLRMTMPGEYAVRLRGSGRAKVSLFLNDRLIDALPSRIGKAVSPSPHPSPPHPSL